MIKIEVRDHPKKVDDEIIVLVNDHRRLKDEVHEEVINKWFEALPWDMHLHQHEEREEYSKLSKTSYRQLFKHWWSMQNLPPEVKYVIKVRNDIEFPPRLVEEHLVKLIKHLRIKEKDVSIGFGTMGWDKHTYNIIDGEINTLGDLILFHPVECFQNPYDHMDKLCDKKVPNSVTAHNWWGRLLKGQKYQIDWHQMQIHR